MKRVLTAICHEWNVADENDRSHVRWGALVAIVYVGTAIAALIMQVVL